MAKGSDYLAEAWILCRGTPTVMSRSGDGAFEMVENANMNTLRIWGEGDFVAG